MEVLSKGAIGRSQNLETALGSRKGPIGCPVHAHVVACTPLKAPSGHPRLLIFRGRSVRTDAGGGDGATSGGATKKRWEYFGHRPPYFAPYLARSSLTTQIQIRLFPRNRALPLSRSKAMSGASSLAMTRSLIRLKRIYNF
jgi:hypothetical protein